ncbi:MAG: DNA alkylation repair protein, partial [Bacteroidia bacterium]|nr:DNA alkylation repair protein [Bacteroidia bacterium]
MADELKEMFDAKYYENLATQVQKLYPSFNKKSFLQNTCSSLEDLSLNQRLRNTSVVLKKHLPDNYKKTISLFYDVIETMPKGYTSLVFPDFVGLYGHNDFKMSMDALKHFTSFGSSEFAIREFLRNDFSKTIKVMEGWAIDQNYHIRRLASEGSRARLPWSFKLDEVIHNPQSTAVILHSLKEDNELYVKKSVANHLNDISKDNPHYMLQLIDKWDKSNAHTAWIVKHASRTLIKKGDKKVLQIFNYEKNEKVEIQNFKIKQPKLKIGETLEFSFFIVSKKSKTQKIVIDYAIHYVKKGGDTSAKVFKLKELDLVS